MFYTRKGLVYSKDLKCKSIGFAEGGSASGLRNQEGPYVLPLWNQVPKTILKMLSWDLIP